MGLATHNDVQLESDTVIRIDACPLGANWDQEDFVRYAYMQWKSGTPVIDPLHGPHCLVDMIRYWAFVDMQEQDRRMEALSKHRG